MEYNCKLTYGECVSYYLGVRKRTSQKFRELAICLFMWGIVLLFSVTAEPAFKIIWIIFGTILSFGIVPFALMSKQCRQMKKSLENHTMKIENGRLILSEFAVREFPLSEISVAWENRRIIVLQQGKEQPINHIVVPQRLFSDTRAKQFFMNALQEGAQFEFLYRNEDNLCREYTFRFDDKDVAHMCTATVAISMQKVSEQAFLKQIEKGKYQQYIGEYTLKLYEDKFMFQVGQNTNYRRWQGLTRLIKVDDLYCMCFANGVNVAFLPQSAFGSEEEEQYFINFCREKGLKPEMIDTKSSSSEFANEQKKKRNALIVKCVVVGLVVLAVVNYVDRFLESFEAEYSDYVPLDE